MTGEPIPHPPLRAVMIVAATTMVMEAMLFAVMAPLLPYYVDHIGLTKTEASAVSAIYGLGALVFALPSGALVARYGSRRTMLGALVVLAVSSMCVGLSHAALPLEAARFAQGAAGGTLWTAGLGWVAALAPPERRGQVLGSMTGVGIAGALLGPPIGAFAVLVGPTAVFAALATVAAALIAVVLRLSAGPPQVPDGPRMRVLARASSRGDAALAAWLVVAAAMGTGLVNVLGPLRLDALSAGAGVIGVVFLIAAASEAGLNPLAGRVIDRRGIAAVVQPALVLAAVPLLLLVPQHTVAGLGVAIVACMAVLGTFWVPGALMLTAAATRAGLTDSQGIALFNVAWALGLTCGGSIGGGLAAATSDIVPCAILAAVLLTTFALLRVRPRLPGRETVAAARKTI